MFLLSVIGVFHFGLGGKKGNMETQQAPGLACFFSFWPMAI